MLCVELTVAPLWSIAAVLASGLRVKRFASAAIVNCASISRRVGINLRDAGNEVDTAPVVSTGCRLTPEAPLISCVACIFYTNIQFFFIKSSSLD